MFFFRRVGQMGRTDSWKLPRPLATVETPQCGRVPCVRPTIAAVGIAFAASAMRADLLHNLAALGSGNLRPPGVGHGASPVTHGGPLLVHLHLDGCTQKVRRNNLEAGS